RILRTVKTRHPKGYLQGRYTDNHSEVALDDRPFEFFMNRFRLLEPAPRADFPRFTGLSEESIRPAIEQALRAGYIEETTTHWQLTEHGKLFLNSLLELFITLDT
ncbi:MAG: radical SAM family heme chaperone HemW, partial [Plesiomonas shigelloides]